MSVIKYSPGINPLTPKGEKIVTDTLDKIGLPSITITSTYRTPKQQALAMYTNIVNTGVDAQNKLYGPNGKLVIAVYVLKKNYGYGQSDILKAMEDKIIALGPSNVSAHCVEDHANFQTFDILPDSIPTLKKPAFETAMKAVTSKLLIPGVTTGEPVYHAEIKSILLKMTEAVTKIVPLLLIVAISYLYSKRDQL